MTLGHTTVVAEALYFGTPDGDGQEPAAALQSMIARIGELSLNVSALLTPSLLLHVVHAKGPQCKAKQG